MEVEERLKKMEDMIQRMATQFAATQPAKSRREAGESAPVPGFVEPAPKRKSALRRPEKEEGSQLEGLGPTVVAAAVEAGVPIEQLKHLGSLLKKTTRMQDVATSQKARPVRRNLLSESEDEDEDAAEEEEEKKEQEGEGSQVAQAVVKLTQIMEEFTRKRPSVRDLESLLDGAEGSGEPSSSSTSSKSKAAAYKKLREALTKHPEIIAQTIEDLMSEDFGQMKAAPGGSAREVSTRAWIEHRSKLQHYVGSIRQAWILGGIHDAMRKKNWQEAKARTLLGIMALDQEVGLWHRRHCWKLQHHTLRSGIGSFPILGSKRSAV